MNISGKLFLAPMAGITDSFFRNICRQYGADIVCTELISVQGLIHGNSETMRMLSFREAERPIGVQLFGSKPQSFEKAVKKIEQSDFDFIDINMGCSVKKVMKTGSGAALLDKPEIIGDIIKAVCSVTDKPVSCKIRLGLKHNNSIDIAQKAQDAGISFITVHGRTSMQKFSGNADWASIYEIAENIDIPVIGNGDIGNAYTALEHINKGVVAGIMIGRAALSSPWIFRQIRDVEHDRPIYCPDINERISLIVKHYESGNTEDRNHIRKMRKHFHWYTKGLKNIRRYREMINRTENYKEIEEILDELSKKAM